MFKKTLFGALLAATLGASQIGMVGSAQATRPDPPTLDSCKAWVSDYGHSNATTVYATFYVECPSPVLGSIWVAGAILQGKTQKEVTKTCTFENSPLYECHVTGKVPDPAGTQTYHFLFDPEGTDVSYATAGRVGCPQMDCYTVNANL
jgi:hypothetical protein